MGISAFFLTVLTFAADPFEPITHDMDDETLGELLGDESEAAAFEGGEQLTIYLHPRNYHRVHSPVTGAISGSCHMSGELFPVHADAARAIPGLFALNERLAPVGEVVLSIPNVAHLWVRLSLLLGRFEYAGRGILDRTHVRFFTERSLRALLSDAGLRLVHLEPTPVPLPQGRERRGQDEDQHRLPESPPDLPRPLRAQPALYLDRRQPLAEQSLRLSAHGPVSRDEQHWAPPRPAESCVDPGLADRSPVEVEVLPGLSRDGVVQDAVRRSGHGVHGDEERRVAALLQELGVPGPALLHDVLAGGIEEIVELELTGDEREALHASAEAVREVVGVLTRT
jgi:hypothetical protein